MGSFYEHRIKDEIKRQGYSEISARHVEAYMKLAHSVLDGLSRMEFTNEVRIGIQCVLVGGIDHAESCAKSFGL